MVHITNKYIMPKLDKEGDITMVTRPESGAIDINLVSGQAALEQIVRTHLLTRLGEDPLSPNIGLPVPEIVGVFNADFIEGSIRRALFKDSRVKQVKVNIRDFDPKDRVTTVDVDVKTIANEEASSSMLIG